MRLTLIVLVALALAAHSQQAILQLRVTSSSLATVSRHLIGSTISIDSVKCKAMFRYCNGHNIDMITGQGMSTMMYCSDGRSQADSFVTKVIVDNGRKMCDAAKEIDSGKISEIKVAGKSGSLTLTSGKTTKDV